MTKCSLCGEDVDDADIKWRNPVRALSKSANGTLNMGTIEHSLDPGQRDPGAAPYCSKCREKLDKNG